MFAIDVDTGPAGDLTFITDDSNFVVEKTDNQSAVIKLADTSLVSDTYLALC